MAGIKAATIYVVTVSLSLLILGLYIVGTARYLTDLEENTCEMTYMFEYPQYVKIALDDDDEERYPRFDLYAYGEGFVTQKLRRMKFSGIPVLFVPGNGGSHEQVRSLASVSLRKSIKDRMPFHFDYFTVSLGGDYSALYGGVLAEETSYVSLCISRILSLYKGKVHKVVLIGHSMGGIVAKGALLTTFSVDSNGEVRNDSLASILVTMAAPHNPIFLPDRTIALYYEIIERSSHLLRKMGTTFVSIGGGGRDVLVSSSQAIDSSGDLNLVTSGMPDVWRSIDHLCILWCKQLILTIVRALFDCVDRNARPPAIASDSRYRLRALSYHFMSRVSGKKLLPYDDKEEFKGGAEWIEDARRQYTWTNHRKDFNKTVFLMIRLDSPSYDSLSLESIDLDAKDWIFACSAHSIQGNSRVCNWGWNLTNRTTLSPDPMHHSRKKLDIDMKDLRNVSLSHIVVRIPANEIRGKKYTVKIHVDLYRASDRTVGFSDATVGPAAFFNILLLRSIWAPNPYGSVLSSRGSLTYRVILTDILDAVSVGVEPVNEDGSAWWRSKSDGGDDPQVVLELFQHSRNDGYSASEIRMVTFKKGESVRKQRAVLHLGGKMGMLKVNLGAEYSYRVTIRRAGTVERVACSVRERWPTLYPITLALCLLGVAMRIDDSPRKITKTCGITLLLVLTFDCLLETLVAIGLIHVFAVTTCCLVVFFGSVAHNIASRFLARIVALPSVWFEWLLGGLDRLPLFTCILLTLMSATCSAIGVLLSVALFFLKLTKIYDEYLEELLMASLRQFNPFERSRRKRKRSPMDSTQIVGSPVQQLDSATNDDQSTSKTRRESILDTLLLFVTFSFAAIPAIPSALVWAKNFRYETRLTTEEPTMALSWIVLTGWASLGFIVIPPNQCDNRSKLRTLFCGSVLRSVSYILLYTACLENSARYQWIAPPLVALCFTCVALLSLLSARSTPEENSTALNPTTPQ